MIASITTPTTTVHQWESARTTRHPLFLVCAICGRRLTEDEPGDWKAAFYSPCPGLSR
jgi:hypothetical protein